MTVTSIPSTPHGVRSACSAVLLSLFAHSALTAAPCCLQKKQVKEARLKGGLNCYCHPDQFTLPCKAEAWCKVHKSNFLGLLIWAWFKIWEQNFKPENMNTHLNLCLTLNNSLSHQLHLWYFCKIKNQTNKQKTTNHYPVPVIIISTSLWWLIYIPRTARSERAEQAKQKKLCIKP